MKSHLFAAAALAMLAAMPALAQTPDRQISVTGEGIVHAVPDMATITLGVSHQAQQAAAAMEQDDRPPIAPLPPDHGSAATFSFNTFGPRIQC